METSKTLDHRATRWLAKRAFKAGHLDPISWEFIDEAPERAHEVAEFVDWLAGETS